VGRDNRVDVQTNTQRMRTMNANRVVCTVLALAAGAGLACSTQAQTLDLTLLDANQTVTQGTTSVAFDATIFNPSTTATIYLNGASASTASSLLTVDISPFFENAPFSLAPGQSSGPFELFSVDLAAPSLTGSYVGNAFEIQGGADGGSFSAFQDVADANFSVTIKSSVVTAPEIDPSSAISGLFILLGGLAVMRGRRGSPTLVA
jgi:hypothetical protein